MNLDNYEDVDSRIHKFYAANPGGRIITHLEHIERGANGAALQYIVRAEIYTDTLISSGYAEEIVGTSKVNTTSALENCETSAIGRGLANAGYSAKGARPSVTEMGKAARVKPTGPVDDPWTVAPPVDNFQEETLAPAVALIAAQMGGVIHDDEHPLRGPQMMSDPPSAAQMKWVTDLISNGSKELGVNGTEYLNAILSDIGYPEVTGLDALGKRACSAVIKKLTGKGH